ncbi:MAG: cyclic nucleotide-binding domain-containing protein [Rhizobiales bacterium]|nr:cyclic nucleotide-binding domain-containing protein [Hyphomicrobiales bacterium]
MPYRKIDLARIVEGPLVDYPDGRVVFIRGDEGDKAYIVESGRIDIREGGRVIEAMQPGEIFGELALIDGETRSASAVAVGPTRLIVIEKDQFFALLHDHPDFALGVMRLMTRRLRTRFVDEKPPEVTPLPVAPRLSA